MDLRSMLSTLFFAGGVVFFVLAAANFWGLNTQPQPIPLDKVTSTPNATINLQRLTEQPLMGPRSSVQSGLNVIREA